MRHHRWAGFVSAGALLGLSLAASAGTPHASGERSWTRPKPVGSWKHGAYPAQRVAHLTYAELPVERLLRLQRANATRVMKPAQIGLAREASLEADRRRGPALDWVPTGSGGAVARLEVRSPDALALRVGLRVDRLDDRVELRFAGSDDPRRVVAVLGGDEIKRLAGPGGMFWTPSTDGEAQVIEVFRPAGVRADAVRLEAPRLSHLVTNSRNDFKLLEKIGESGTCNVDTSCRVAELGPRFVEAKNAVAHMQFIVDGSAYICTGTLLADTVPSTQVPYFYSANHCFASGSGTPDPARMQTVANTLNTFWNYEATACRSGIAAPRTQLVGGAVYLYSDERSDAMLLRLNHAAPAGAFFAGWTAAPLPASAPILGIHHPRGDVKKASLGQHVFTTTEQHRVGWTSGTTEGGSSGSAIFTLGPDGYELRGGLHGGAASCANTGSLSNSGNWDTYSRFDVVFPRVAHHLASEAVARNGAEPLLPPRPSGTGAPAAVDSPASAGAAATPRRSAVPALPQRSR